MGTLNAIYIRTDTTGAISIVKSAYPEAYTEAGLTFHAVEFPVNKFEPPELDLKNISAELNGDVIWLGFQSAVDAFQYYHWKSGRLLRKLVYGCFNEERTWECVEGNADPWEEEAIFGTDALARILRHVNDENERRNLQHIWRNKVIEPNSFEPLLDARETARKVAEHYRLPGWSLSTPKK